MIPIIKKKFFLNIFIRRIDGNLKDTNTLHQNGPENNINKRVLYIPQRPKTTPSPSDGLV